MSDPHTNMLIMLGLIEIEECHVCNGYGYEVGTQTYYSSGGHFVEGEEECYIDCYACDGKGEVEVAA